MPDACFAPPVMGADVKAFQDAAPFYAAHEWRHGIKKRLADDYAKISPAWLIVIYEVANARLGFRRGDLGQCDGWGAAEDSMVYWPQDSFFWRKSKIEVLEQIPRAYNSLTDKPSRETYDKQLRFQKDSGRPRRDFEKALAFGLDAESKILNFLRQQTGFGLWPLNQETLRVHRYYPAKVAP